MKIVLDNGAYMPTRAHDADAGLDLYSTKDVTVPLKAVRYLTQEYTLSFHRTR